MRPSTATQCHQVRRAPRDADPCPGRCAIPLLNQGPPFSGICAGHISQRLLPAAIHLCLALVVAAVWVAVNRRGDLPSNSFRYNKAHASDVGLASMIQLEARASGIHPSSTSPYKPRGLLAAHPEVKRLLVRGLGMPCAPCRWACLLRRRTASARLLAPLRSSLTSTVLPLLDRAVQLDLQLDLKRVGLGFFSLKTSWRCMFPAACRLALAAAAVGSLLGAGEEQLLPPDPGASA